MIVYFSYIADLQGVWIGMDYFGLEGQVIGIDMFVGLIRVNAGGMGLDW